MQEVDVLIIGGGASGTAAGIQSARMGAQTLLIEEYDWLGGALSSAGVGAIDGNYNLPAGIFGEMRNKLIEFYGSEDSLKLAWVSSVAAEPSTYDKVFKELTGQEDRLNVWYRSTVKKITKENSGWIVEIEKNNEVQTVRTSVIIDGTELGDIAKLCGVTYDIGMEARSASKEQIAPEQANSIIQDLTYVAIVKDYGKDVTMEKPDGYDPSLFYCTCNISECTTPKNSKRLWDCNTMLSYGKLPNNKYMINWPIEGNDFYLNLIEMEPAERKEALKAAKHFTMCYLYYMQTALGFNTIGLADDEFPTEDKLPFIPYHRESRRIHGLVRFNLNHITHPYTQPQSLYRTCIAVGDYPVDHHHDRYTDYGELPDLYFYPVPSFGLPLGTLIPEKVDNLLVTEKSISVSNLTNGATRLQPVLIQIGQAAGITAALAVQQKQKVSDVSVRSVQEALLNANGYLFPYLDLPLTDMHFKALQRIGSTGLLRGRGVNAGWSNQTWFDTDTLLSVESIQDGFADFYPQFNIEINSSTIRIGEAIRFIDDLEKYLNTNSGKTQPEEIAGLWEKWGLKDFDIYRAITRKEFAVLLDETVDPFHTREVNINGKVIFNTN